MPFAGGSGIIKGTARTQRFTASGLWPKPVNCKAVYIVAVGGGQGGGGACTVNNFGQICSAGGGGGGGGNVISGWYEVTQNISIVIGAGGAGAPAPTDPAGIANIGTNGGDTILSGGLSITAKGGGSAGHQGGQGFVPGAIGQVGGGGAASGGPYNPSAYQISGTPSQGFFVGNASKAGVSTDNGLVLGQAVGMKGSKGFGGGGSGGFAFSTYYALSGLTIIPASDGGGMGAVGTSNVGINGFNATANTGGGGGGCAMFRSTTSGFSTAAGGNGADGIVIITWWE